MFCLWQKMDTTSCLDPWLFSRVTAHKSEVRVLWATMDTKPFFTFSLKISQCYPEWNTRQQLKNINVNLH